MELDLELTQADWLNFNKYVQRKIQKGLLGGFWPNVVIWFLITILFVFLFQRIDRLHWPSVGFVSIIFVLLIGYFFLNIAKAQKALMPSLQGTFVGDHHFEFNEKGIYSNGRGYNGFHEWSTVKAIEQGNQMVLIFLDTAYAFVFPETQLEDVEKFVIELNQLKA